MFSQATGCPAGDTCGSSDMAVSCPLHCHQKSIDSERICAHHQDFLKAPHVTCSRNWNWLSYANEFCVLIYFKRIEKSLKAIIS